MRSRTPLEVQDPDRLQAVTDLDLTGRPDPSFDEMAQAAAGLLDVPVGFVTVVDAERSWYTGAVGLPADGDRSRPIDESFEKLVVGTGRALVVNDAARDPRTRDDAGIAASGLRAWAGFPVRDVRGQVLGTFGVADPEPREWTAGQVDALRVLAQAASDQVQLRLALRAERKARERRRVGVDRGRDGPARPRHGPPAGARGHRPHPALAPPVAAAAGPGDGDRRAVRRQQRRRRHRGRLVRRRRPRRRRDDLHHRRRLWPRPARHRRHGPGAPLPPRRWPSAARPGRRAGRARQPHARARLRALRHRRPPAWSPGTGRLGYVSAGPPSAAGRAGRRVRRRTCSTVGDRRSTWAWPYTSPEAAETTSPGATPSCSTPTACSSRGHRTPTRASTASARWPWPPSSRSRGTAWAAPGRRCRPGLVRRRLRPRRPGPGRAARPRRPGWRPSSR